MASLFSGWLERGKFMAMAHLPNDHHLIAMKSVIESGSGIDAIANRTDGLECVQRGWLKHRAHRHDEGGGLTDVWDLTPEGRELLDVILRERQSGLAA